MRGALGLGIPGSRAAFAPGKSIAQFSTSLSPGEHVPPQCQPGPRGRCEGQWKLTQQFCQNSPASGHARNGQPQDLPGVQGFLMLSKQLQPLQILARHLSARPFTLQSSLSLGVAYCNDQLLKTFKQRFRNRIVQSFGDKFKTRQRDRNRLSTPGKPLPQLLGKEWHKGVKQV